MGTVRRQNGEPADEQQRLAGALVDCLGRDGAIHACQANAWDGVLDFVLSHPPTDKIGSRHN